ncbi:MAG: hypothetical protein WBH03_23330 [Cyclobacteriaceae bacterium]
MAEKANTLQSGVQPRGMIATKFNFAAVGIFLYLFLRSLMRVSVLARHALFEMYNGVTNRACAEERYRMTIG